LTQRQQKHHIAHNAIRNQKKSVTLYLCYYNFWHFILHTTYYWFCLFTFAVSHMGLSGGGTARPSRSTAMC